MGKGNGRKKSKSKSGSVSMPLKPIVDVPNQVITGPEAVLETLEHRKPAKPAKPINCHYIPQWILRHFGRQEAKGAPQKQKDIRVYCYNVGTGKLIHRPTKDVYAVGDLYKDSSNPLDVDGYIEIEDKLGKLEGVASRTVQMVLDTLSSRDRKMDRGEGTAPVEAASLTIKRKYLDDLRKFLFLMYYHQNLIGPTYFQEDHAGNFKTRRWIKAYRERHNLPKSPRDIWRHVLRFYLNTPHKEIVEMGQRAQNQMLSAVSPNHKVPVSFAQRIAEFQSQEVDPELEGWKCLNYFTMMQPFLTIWEAAPGEEFLLSDNSFRLYEGMTAQEEPIHELFVVSPRIVLVLCNPALNEPRRDVPEFANARKPSFRLRPEDLATSMLAKAPHNSAKVTYQCVEPALADTPIASPELMLLGFSPEDCFEFEISTLSAEDTHNINTVILGNVVDHGQVTFGSKEAALRTLDKFGDNQAFDNERRMKFAPLVKELLKATGDSSGFRLERFGPSIRSLYLSSRSPDPGTYWERNFEIYRMLHEGNDPDSIGYQAREGLNFSQWPVREPSGTEDRPARLVRKMDDVLARRVFADCEKSMALGTAIRSYKVFKEQILIGFLERLLKHHRAVFDICERNTIASLYSDADPQVRRTAAIKEYTDV